MAILPTNEFEIDFPQGGALKAIHLLSHCFVQLSLGLRQTFGQASFTFAKMVGSNVVKNSRHLYET